MLSPQAYNFIKGALSCIVGNYLEIGVYGGDGICEQKIKIGNNETYGFVGVL